MNGKYLTFIFYRNPLDKSLSLYFHQGHKSNYRQYDEWINDSLYPNCSKGGIENWPFTPSMNSSYFEERYVPLITEDYMNGLKLIFSIMGYPLYDPPNEHGNSYEVHMKHGNETEKHYISYDVIKRFEICNQGQYQEYFNAIHLYYRWKKLVHKN